MKTIKTIFFSTLIFSIILNSIFAEFKVGAKLNVDFSVFNYSQSFTEEQKASESMSAFSNFDFSTSNLYAEYNWEEKVGFTLKLNVTPKLMAWKLDAKTFSDTKVWLKLPYLTNNIFFFDVGFFDSAKVNLVDSAIGEWSYGAITTGDSNNIYGKVLETDKLKYAIVGTTIGVIPFVNPITIEFAPIMDSIDLDGFKINKESGKKHTLNFNMATRFSIGILEYAKLTGTYHIKYDWESLTGEKPSGGFGTTPDITNTIHTYGIFAELGKDIVSRLDVVLGYSGSITKREAETSTEKEAFFVDKLHTIDARVQYVLPILPNYKFTIATHNKIGLGSDVGGTLNSLSLTPGSYPNLFSVWNSLAFQMNVTPKFVVSLIGINKYIKESKDENTYNIKNMLTVKASAKYNFTDKISVKSGITFDMPLAQGKNNGTENAATKNYNVSMPCSVTIEF